MEQLHNGNYSMVKIGKYLHTTRTTRHPGEWDELITELRRKIEENIELLPIVTVHFFPDEKSGLRFKYKFSSVDEERKKLILRYFAPIAFPRVLAGYQCQFVVDLKKNELEQILLSEIPLER